MYIIIHETYLKRIFYLWFNFCSWKESLLHYQIEVLPAALFSSNFHKNDELRLYLDDKNIMSFTSFII